MSEKFLDDIRIRRSVYTIKNSSPIPDEKIVEIVTECTKHCPSSLNMMPVRTVLLLGAEHDKFWKIADEGTKAKLSPEDYAGVATRLAGFAGGYGTVLFYINRESVEELAIKHSKIALKTWQFAEHSSAINQYTIWTALALEGFGCSLQHKNPEVDTKTRETWNLPDSWVLTAQLVFGEKTAPPKEKVFKSIEDKVLIFK